MGYTIMVLMFLSIEGDNLIARECTRKGQKEISRMVEQGEGMITSVS